MAEADILSLIIIVVTVKGIVKFLKNSVLKGGWRKWQK